MKTSARFAGKRWLVFQRLSSINDRCLWVAFVAFCSIAHASSPPHPNLINKFSIGYDDTLLVSTSDGMYVRGSADGSTWATTTPEASPTLNLLGNNMASPFRNVQVDSTRDHRSSERSVNGSLAPNTLCNLPDNGGCLSLTNFSGHFYAGAGDKVYVSRDPGKCWTRILGPPGVRIQQLFAGPTHGLYASANTNNEKKNVSYKYDPGRDWQVLDFGKPAIPRIDPDASWHSESDFQPKLISMIDDILYASSLAGLIRSLDGGLNWEPFRPGCRIPSLPATLIRKTSCLSYARMRPAYCTRPRCGAYIVLPSVSNAGRQ